VTTQGGAVSIGISNSTTNSDVAMLGSIDTTGGAVTIVSDSALALSGIESEGGAVSLKADKIALSEMIDAGSGVVTLAPYSNSTPINLGVSSPSGSGSALEFSAPDLRFVKTSGSLIIGGSTMTGALTVAGALDLTSLAGLTGTLLLNAGSGNIAVNAPLSAPGTLVLSTSGTISQNSSGLITADALKAVGSTVTLAEAANAVGTIAGEATSGNFQYYSAPALMVGSVDSSSGISVPTGSNIKLVSDSSSGIGQESGSPLVGGGLALQTIGPVELTDANNNVATIAANLNPRSEAAGSFEFLNAADLDVGSVLSISGITTRDQRIKLGLAANKRLTVDQSIDPGSEKVSLGIDLLTLNSTVGGDIVSIRPVSANRKITVGASTCSNSPSSCLLIKELYNVTATTIGLGSTDTDNLVGDIYVAGITATGGNAVTDRNADTTRIGLLTQGSVSQGGAIDVQDLGIEAGATVNLSSASNTVSNIAGSSVGDFTFVNSQALRVIRLSGGVAPHDYNVNGIASGGDISVSATSGNLTVAAPIVADTTNGTVSLTAASGAIGGSGSVTGASLNASASGGIALLSYVNSLQATNSGASGDIDITNVGVLAVSGMEQTSTGGTGDIALNNYGALTVTDSVSVSGSGDINLVARSPLTVGTYGSVSSNAGAITLEAGSSGSSNDVLTINGSVASATGNITLIAGESIVRNGTLNGSVTLRPNGNHAGASTASTGSSTPTLSQCIENSTVAGCNTVLPSLDSCISNPTLAGCGARMPTLTSCTVTPTLAGCSVVLPSVSQCTTSPTAAGCVAVLPPISRCTTAPGTAGCSVVLPSVNQCTINPTAAGCSVVLPSVDQCTTNPAAAGCVAVLPSISRCTAAPGTAGCSAVLPSVAQCTTNASADGCLAVLPALTQCVSSPTMAGCGVVLPSLDRCAATPTLAGCAAVLPTLSACLANPGTTGCGTVLPSSAQCAAMPTMAGCGTTTVPPVTATAPPTLSCLSTPTLAGCEGVASTGLDQSNTTLTQAINSTIKVMSPSNEPVVTVATIVSTAIQQHASPSENTHPPSTSVADEIKSSANKDEIKKDIQDDNKKDNQKDSKKETVAVADNGEKKNAVATKMYCN